MKKKTTTKLCEKRLFIQQKILVAFPAAASTPAATKTPKAEKSSTAKKVKDEDHDPYDIDTEIERHPEPLKNIQVMILVLFRSAL